MAINYETDTISAIATPFGTGAIGIIRMSGFAKKFSQKNLFR